MEIEQAILTKLQATSGVTSLVGSGTNARIYYAGHVPQNVSLPYLTIQKISAGRTHAHSGPSGLVSSRIQITCFDDSYLGAKALAVAVQAAIDGFSGLASTVYVGFCLYDNETDIPDEDNTGISGIGADYLIMYNE